jgi:HSP20 family protein
MTTENTRKEADNGTALVEATYGGATYRPRFDIWENEEELVLCGDLPGVVAEDLDIRFENRELVIHARVAPRHPPQEMLLAEYGVGDFHRTFRIGEAIDGEKIYAELKQGMLILHLPKLEAVKPRKISVRAD